MSEVSSDDAGWTLLSAARNARRFLAPEGGAAVEPTGSPEPSCGAGLALGRGPERVHVIAQGPFENDLAVTCPRVRELREILSAD